MTTIRENSSTNRDSVYLDHAASTPVHPEALRVLYQAYLQDYANPAAQHPLSQSISLRVENSRNFLLESIRATLGYRLIFVGSATEANNLLIKGLNLKSDDGVIYHPADHPSIVGPCLGRGQSGVKTLTSLEHPYDLTQAHQVKLVCASQVQSFTGACLNLDIFSKKIKQLFSQAHLHIDASQSYGKLPIDLQGAEVDSITLSAHKMGGPRGIAALVIRDNISLEPLLTGGPHEYNMRASTLTAPLIFSWIKAVDHLLGPRKNWAQRELYFKQVEGLHQFLRNLLLENLPESKMVLSQDHLNSLFWNQLSPYIFTLILPNVPADVMVRFLGEKKIYISTQSACSTKKKNQETDFALRSLGVAHQFHDNILRISFGYSTTEPEILFLVQEMNHIYRTLLSLGRKPTRTAR